MKVAKKGSTQKQDMQSKLPKMQLSKEQESNNLSPNSLLKKSQGKHHNRSMQIKRSGLVKDAEALVSIREADILSATDYDKKMDGNFEG